MIYIAILCIFHVASLSLSLILTHGLKILILTSTEKKKSIVNYFKNNFWSADLSFFTEKYEIASNAPIICSVCVRKSGKNWYNYEAIFHAELTVIAGEIEGNDFVLRRFPRARSADYESLRPKSPHDSSSGRKRETRGMPLM